MSHTENCIIDDLEHDGEKYPMNYMPLLAKIIDRCPLKDVVSLVEKKTEVLEVSEVPEVSEVSEVPFPQRGLAKIANECDEFAHNIARIIASYARGIFITINAKHGSGKTLLANLLCKKYKFYKISFCSPLKRMLNCGGGLPQIYGTDSDKNVPAEMFDGKSARQVMRITGQNIQLFCRLFPGLEYVWCRIIDDRLCRYPMRNHVADDAYLPHWIKLAHMHSGIHILLHRESVMEYKMNHPTQDMSQNNHDIEIFNNGTLDDYKKRIDQLIQYDLRLT